VYTHMTPLPLFLPADSVKASGGRVLVHCHAGVSRSATVCMAYVMKNLDYDLRSAYDFVKARRPCVSPNLHFMGQLLEFEKRLGTCLNNVDAFTCSLACVQEDEFERPCALPASWVSKDKRRAVSTPSSLQLCPATPTSAPTHKSTLSPGLFPPISSSSLPCTPLQAQVSLPHKSPLRGHTSHSCSLQSLAVPSPCSVAAKNCLPFCHLPVTESL
jgi:dual specificity MAP kinase phosphatase